MKSHELAKQLLAMPNVSIKLSTHMSYEVFEFSGLLNIHEDDLTKSILPDSEFLKNKAFEGSKYIELYAVKD